MSLSQFNLIILSILQEHLKGFGFILHASASCVNGKAYIFCGPSGVGKSTIAKLLCPEFKQLADDSVIIRRENKEYFLYQTPLMEKNSTLFSRASTQYKIAKLCFLRQSIHTRLNHIVNKDQATHQLLNQLWINERTKQQMSLIFTFLKNNNFFYEFEFQKKKGALMKSISTIEDHNP